MDSGIRVQIDENTIGDGKENGLGMLRRDGNDDKKCPEPISRCHQKKRMKWIPGI